MFKIEPRNANLVCTVVRAGINLSTHLKATKLQTIILSVFSLFIAMKQSQNEHLHDNYLSHNNLLLHPIPTSNRIILFSQLFSLHSQSKSIKHAVMCI